MVGKPVSRLTSLRFGRLAAGTMLLVCVVTNTTGCRKSKSDATGSAASARPASSAAAPARTIPAPSDVAAAPADAEKLPSGVASKRIKPGTGDVHPVDNDCVKVHFASWKRDGSLFSTSRFRSEPDMQCMRKMVPGVAEALKFMVVGETRRIWVPKHLTFKAAEEGQKVPDLDLTFEVELVELLKAPETPTDLKEPPKTAKKTKTGLVYQVLKKSDNKTHPTNQNRVKVRYSGWRPDGSLFETTELSRRPAEFSFGDMLPGWSEGLKLMTVGEKTRFWLPANLAYGDKPRRGSPAGPLIYDIELLEIL